MGGIFTKPEPPKQQVKKRALSNDSHPSIGSFSNMSALSRRSFYLSMHPVIYIKKQFIDETQSILRHNASAITSKKQNILSQIEKLT